MLEECDVYIYDMHFGDTKDIQYVASIFSQPLEEQRVLILISNVMAWNKTAKKVKVDKPPEKNEDE